MKNPTNVIAIQHPQTDKVILTPQPFNNLEDLDSFINDCDKNIQPSSEGNVIERTVIHYKNLNMPRPNEVTVTNSIKPSDQNTASPKKEKRIDVQLSITNRIIYACFLAFFYGIGGLVIDITMTVLRAIVANNFSSTLWLFTPILTAIGFILGFANNQKHTSSTSSDKDLSIATEVLSGVLIAISISVVLWFFVLLIT